MKLSVINKLYKGQMLLKCAPHYVHPTGTTPTPSWGTPQKCPWEKGGILSKEGSSVPGGCTYCTALRGMKGTYIGSPSMISSILYEIPSYEILAHVFREPQNLPKSQCLVVKYTKWTKNG